MNSKRLSSLDWVIQKSKFWDWFIISCTVFIYSLIAFLSIQGMLEYDYIVEVFGKPFVITVMVVIGLVIPAIEMSFFWRSKSAGL